MATESEKIFEQYLTGQNIAWQRFPVTNRKHPDYQVEHGRTTCLFEIKEFDAPATIRSAAFSPCDDIKAKFSQARKQFRFWRQNCCALVLWNSKNIYTSLLTDAVASAAFGERLNVDMGMSSLRAEPPRYQFYGRAELRPKMNTTFSAIIILAPYKLNHLWLEMWRVLDRKQKEGEEITPWLQFEIIQQLSGERIAPSFSYEGTIRTIVLENPYARVGFPKDLFVGPFDQRWGVESGWFTLSFMGAEITKLKQSGVPFIYL